VYSHSLLYHMLIPVDMRTLTCASGDLIGSPSKPDFENMYVIPYRSIQLRWCLGIAEGIGTPQWTAFVGKKSSWNYPDRTTDWEDEGSCHWRWRWRRESASCMQINDTESGRIKCPYLILMGCPLSPVQIWIT